MGKVDFPAEYAGVAGVGEPARCTLSSGYGGRTLTVAARRGPDPWEDRHPGNVALTKRLGMPAVFAVATLFPSCSSCSPWLITRMGRWRRRALPVGPWGAATLVFAAACKGLHALKRRGRQEE